MQLGGLAEDPVVSLYYNKIQVRSRPIFLLQASSLPNYDHGHLPYDIICEAHEQIQVLIRHWQRGGGAQDRLQILDRRSLGTSQERKTEYLTFFLPVIMSQMSSMRERTRVFRQTIKAVPP